MNSLDSILSGGGEAVSEQQTTEETVTLTEAELPPQGHGPEIEAELAESEGESGQRVPVAALQAERAKVRRYTDEVADFRKALTETNASFERRMAELVEAVKPKPEPVAAPDQFDDFQGATRHAVKPEIDRVSQALMANAQMIAGIKYGDDKVAEAEKAFAQAYESRQIDPSDIQKVLNAPNIYAASVQWHQRQQAQAEIGDDPAAYRAKVEAEIRAKLEAEINGGGQQQAKPALATPSNLTGARNMGARSGPAWSGPQPIADIFARR